MDCNVTLIDDYVSKRSIEEDIQDLSQPDLSHQDEKTNDLIINLVVKYLLLYLGMKNIRSGIKESVQSRLQERYPGDNIFAGLERIVQLIINPLEDDLFGIECLADIRSTSALVKEIIFRENFEKREDFFALDLGTGTGILLVAGLIAGIRSRAGKIGGLGVDLHNNIGYTEACLQELFPAGKFAVRVFPIDITNPDFHKSLRSLKLSLYISETISLLTPRIIGMNENGATIFEEKNIGEIGDPFPSVLSLTTMYISGFVEKVKQGKIGMFPDPINGLYFPNKDQSTLKLTTGTKAAVLLPDIGQEFQCYEGIDLPKKQNKRWAFQKND